MKTRQFYNATGNNVLVDLTVFVTSNIPVLQWIHVTPEKCTVTDGAISHEVLTQNCHPVHTRDGFAGFFLGGGGLGKEHPTSEGTCFPLLLSASQDTTVNSSFVCLPRRLFSPNE